MSDLISRSALLKEVEKYKFGAISNDTEREYIKSTILDFINFQPTAYSVDKVVEELKESSKWVNETNEYGDDDGNDYIPLSKAIEIVKQGGVSDDVCEWKMDNVGASIGCRSDLHHTGYVNETYCPFCKKKIKVVE